MKIKKLIRACAFLVVAALLWCALSAFLTINGEWSWQSVRAFYQEGAGKADAVYIGSSAVQKFWQPPIAWRHYGIAVQTFASSNQPIEAVPLMVKEARKTQPDALYIINLNGLHPSISIPEIHHAVDYLPYGQTRYELTQRLCDLAGVDPSERSEFYVPFLRYHSSLLNMSYDTLVAAAKNFLQHGGLKAACAYPYYFRASADMTKHFIRTKAQSPLPDSQRQALEELLDYFDAEQVDALFVISPQPKDDVTYLEWLNTAGALVAERGYPLLDMYDSMDEMCLDLTTDYYDTGHVNVHGAMKTTDWFARYLLEHYDFADKRGDPAYADWDAAYEKYRSQIASFALSFEYLDTVWATELNAPKVTVGPDGSLEWTASEGADGYGVFRKVMSGDKEWHQIGTTDGGTLHFRDESYDSSLATYYTVAPFVNGEDAPVWGRYDVRAITDRMPK